MNRIAANQLIIEIIIRLVTGSDGDKASARQMAIFFEKRRRKRGDKLS